MKARLEDLQAKVTKYQQRAVAKADKSEKSSPSRLDFNKTQAADSITSPLGDSDDEGEFRDHLTEHKKVCLYFKPFIQTWGSLFLFKDTSPVSNTQATN